MGNNESAHDKFIRLAESRTQKILDMLRLLGNCSNTYTYEYSQKDVDKIFAAIENELKATKSKFQNSNKEKKFSLK
jgi:hypothetical protein